jgi:RNA polymerase sigma factor for flagellar operon FliA
VSIDDLIQNHLQLSRDAAYRIKPRLPPHVSPDDLMSLGFVGLVEAARRFNPSRRASFRTFAKHRIQGAILDGLRSADHVSRDCRRRFKKATAAIQRLTLTMEKEPAEHEIANELHLKLHAWRRQAREFSQAGLFPRNDPRCTDPEQLEGTLSNGYDAALSCETRAILDGAIQTLPARQQFVIRSYYQHDMTMKEIGRLLGVNESRVSQIHGRIIAALRTRLQGKIV